MADKDVKDNSFSIPPMSHTDSPQRSLMDPSSPSAAAFPSSSRPLAMAPMNQQQHVSPYGPPPPSDQQPASASQSIQHAQAPEHQGQSYPQYSYDIQLRYPQPQQQLPPQQQQQQQNQPLPPHTYPNAPPYTGEPLPPMNYPPVDAAGQNYQFAAPVHSFDTTGQIPSIGMKPRVTATLWEDESTLCFQVDIKGTCVARREDNHMINGTKLLNVAGMTRGRRDGILKSEKNKHVVKIGPMHLKGVWIPYERALEFANKEKITEILYPLFVHNIGALLHHPINRAYGNHQSQWNEDPASTKTPNIKQQIPRSHDSLPSPQSLPGVGGVGGQNGGYMYAAPPQQAGQEEPRG